MLRCALQRAAFAVGACCVALCTALRRCSLPAALSAGQIQRGAHSVCAVLLIVAHFGLQVVRILQVSRLLLQVLGVLCGSLAHTVARFLLCDGISRRLPLEAKWGRRCGQQEWTCQRTEYCYGEFARAHDKYNV